MKSVMIAGMLAALCLTATAQAQAEALTDADVQEVEQLIELLSVPAGVDGATYTDPKAGYTIRAADGWDFESVGWQAMTLKNINLTDERMKRTMNWGGDYLEKRDTNSILIVKWGDFPMQPMVKLSLMEHRGVQSGDAEFSVKFLNTVLSIGPNIYNQFKVEQAPVATVVDGRVGAYAKISHVLPLTKSGPIKISAEMWTVELEQGLLQIVAVTDAAERYATHAEIRKMLATLDLP